MKWIAAARNRQGTATLEFAVVAPLLVCLLVGTIELSNAYRAQSKLNVAVGELAVMVAAASTVTAPSGSLKDFCTGAMFNLAPYATGSVATAIASITNAHPADRSTSSPDNTTVQTYLDWENTASCATSATAMGLSGAKSSANSPSSLLTKNGAPAQLNSDLAYGYSAIVVSHQLTPVALVITLFVFVLTGRWSPRRARQDEMDHEQAVARELAALQQSPVAGR